VALPISATMASRGSSGERSRLLRSKRARRSPARYCVVSSSAVGAPARAAMPSSGERALTTRLMERSADGVSPVRRSTASQPSASPSPPPAAMPGTYGEKPRPVENAATGYLPPMAAATTVWVVPKSMPSRMGPAILSAFRRESKGIPLHPRERAARCSAGCVFRRPRCRDKRGVHRARARKALRLALEILKIDEQRRRQHERALVGAKVVSREQHAEAIGIGERFAEQPRPLLLDARDLRLVAQEDERPRAPDR